MAAISLTYTLSNGTTADASQVMQNFNDIVNGTSDGTKDFSISALTVAGTATLNGNVNIGNASGDDLTITASLASTLAVKTDSTYSIGSTSLRLLRVWTDAISGTPTNDTASAGDVGEYPTPQTGSGTSVAVNTWVQLATISLTAGDWEANGMVEWGPGTVATHAGFRISIVTSSASDGNGGIDRAYFPFNATGSANINQNLNNIRFSLASTTSIYLNARVDGASGATSPTYSLRARRIR